MRFGDWKRWVTRGGALIGLLAAVPAVGCGGIGPGDYVLLRVALTEASLSGDCGDDPDTVNDSSTFRDTQTFVLYAGAGEKFYLDVGQGTLEGTVTDDGYKFAGKSVDVETLGNDDTQTTTNDVSITLTLDGAAASGTITNRQTITFKCADPGCPDDISCTSTSKFSGTVVDDVKLEHDPG